MINIPRLKEGDILKLLVDDKDRGLKAGDLVRVKHVGHSRWDQMDYADVVTDDGYVFEIMKHYRNWELIS